MLWNNDVAAQLIADTDTTPVVQLDGFEVGDISAAILVWDVFYN